MLIYFLQVDTSPGNEGVIYSISWAPADLNCIAGSTSRHGAFIWDIGKGKVIKRYTEVRTPFSLGIGTPVLTKYQIIEYHKFSVIWDIFNPFIAEATFVQSTRMQRFLKNILTLSCWYSLESSCWVLSDEYPCARVPIIFQAFCIILSWQN